MTLDLSHRHAARIERDNALIKTIESPPALGHDYRLERAVAIPRDGQIDRAILR
jgi:hypothetical protein